MPDHSQTDDDAEGQCCVQVASPGHILPSSQSKFFSS